jgi:hypothetical protein
MAETFDLICRSADGRHGVSGFFHSAFRRIVLAALFVAGVALVL